MRAVAAWPDEENWLVAALPAWLKPPVIVAIHTGMRRGELLKLSWDDIDSAQGVILGWISKSGEGAAHFDECHGPSDAMHSPR